MLKPLLDGAATLVPGVQRLLRKRTGGTDSARYCYGVWLRHLCLAARNGHGAVPACVAELGPGDSIGIGLAALLSGAERYVGLDVVMHVELERNLGILEELVELFARRAPIPDEGEFPEVRPRLERYDFPADLLPAGRLAEALRADRIESIRRAVRDPGRAGAMVDYRAPWADASVIQPASVDMILSQAVLEHIDDLDGAYRAMRAWLKPGGLLSHQIDFRSHGLADEWNGHWAYSDLAWRLVRGGRPYLLNREPRSTHERLLEAHGFRILYQQPASTRQRAIERRQLARRFQGMSEEDFATSGWFVQAAAAPRAGGDAVRP
ncbi:MAG: methyltransferase domain-containing protein [Clostridia bacterium]